VDLEEEGERVARGPKGSLEERKAKALKLLAYVDQLSEDITLGLAPKGARTKIREVLLAIRSLDTGLEMRRATEWHRRLQLEVSASSGQVVAERLRISRQAISQYLRRLVRPGGDILARTEATLGIPAVTIWEAPAPPPPPQAADIVKSEHLDGTFFQFVTRGPLHWKLSPAQAALVKVVFDRWEPSWLDGEERDVARLLFGDVEEIPEWARQLALFRFGRRGGKTSLSALYVVWKLNTMDLSEVGLEETPWIALVAKNVQTSERVFQRAKEILGLMGTSYKVDAVFRRETNSAARLVFRRPSDGRRVMLAVVARSAGGVGVRGDWLISAVIDEAEFMSSAKDDAVVQDEDQVSAMFPTLLDGGMILMLSTPWNAGSFMSTTFDTNWGAPKTALCALAPSLLMRPGNAKVMREREKEMARSPKMAAREYDCVPSRCSGALINPKKIHAAVQPWPESTSTSKLRASAGIDLAFSVDWACLVCVERWGERGDDQKILVTIAEIRVPDPEEPFEPSELCDELTAIARLAGARYISADTHGFSSLETATAGTGTLCVPIENKPEEVGMYLRDLILDGRVVIPVWLRHREELVYQLSMLEGKERPGGGMISKKTRIKGHGHLDLASALEAAVWADRRHGPITTKRARTEADAHRSPRGMPTGFDRAGAFLGGATSQMYSPQGARV
jgi:hypothetical protein